MARNSYLIVAKDLLANKSVPVTARLLFAQLLDHRNRYTEQCNPWETKLAAELGVSRWTVMRHLAKLKTAGLIEVKRTQKGNAYKLLAKLQPATSQVAGCNIPSSNLPLCGGPYPLYEPILKEPNARARKRAADSLPNQNHKGNAAAVPRKSAASEILEAYQRLYEKKA